MKKDSCQSISNHFAGFNCTPKWFLLKISVYILVHISCLHYNIKYFYTWIVLFILNLGRTNMLIKLNLIVKHNSAFKILYGSSWHPLIHPSIHLSSPSIQPTHLSINPTDCKPPINPSNSFKPANNPIHLPSHSTDPTHLPVQPIQPANPPIHPTNPFNPFTHLTHPSIHPTRQPTPFLSNWRTQPTYPFKPFIQSTDPTHLRIQPINHPSSHPIHAFNHTVILYIYEQLYFHSRLFFFSQGWTLTQIHITEFMSFYLSHFVVKSLY